MLLQWILNAAALLLVCALRERLCSERLESALIAVVVIGLFNATFGLLLKVITLPLGILTFGLFFLVINAVVLKFASVFVPGFEVIDVESGLVGSAGAGGAAYVDRLPVSQAETAAGMGSGVAGHWSVN